VVIIGGGIIGTSTLFHLVRAGWSNFVLIEKNELTAGSTWHAAGNCPNFAPNWAVMNMQRYGLELYRGLADDVDYPMNYHVTGSLRLAHSKERMQEFAKVSGQAGYQGLEMNIPTNAEVKERHPFLETHDLVGGMWDALDGDIDPAQLTQALAKGARVAGGHIERFCPVMGIDRDDNEWIVKTDKGNIRAEFVVNCAGY
jgi:dimethylglycine dehydrogenase